MKEYTDVVTFGCSFAYEIPEFGGSHDYTKNGPFLDPKTKEVYCQNDHWPTGDESYSGIVSAGLGTNRENVSRVGGSIPYIVRKVFEWCRNNKDKLSSSLILIGLSESQRYESYKSDLGKDLTTTWNYLGWIQETGPVISKDSDKWKNFTYMKPDEVQWLLVVQSIIGLQSFLTLNNIDHVFFDAMTPLKKQKPKNDTLGGTELFDNFVSYDNWYVHPKYESLWYTIKENPNLGAPCTHPNVEGHKYWGESLLEYIFKRENGMIKV